MLQVPLLGCVLAPAKSKSVLARSSSLSVARNVFAASTTFVAEVLVAAGEVARCPGLDATERTRRSTTEAP